MFEVYTGTRPGRPILLVSLSVLSLVAALGVAWSQTRYALRLGEPVHLTDTPIRIRPPVGWVYDDSGEHSFSKVIRVQVWGREMLRAERQILISYVRLRGFVSPQQLLESNGLPATGATPAPIGSLAGLQTRLEHRVAMGPHVKIEERLVRVACSSRGEALLLKYVPLDQITIGDLELFDAVCRSVQFADEASPASALEQAGLSVALPDDVAARSIGQVGLPAVYLSARNAVGDAGWGLDLMRTWVAPGRTPVEILHDLAAALWTGDAETFEPDVATTSRSDGAQISMVEAPPEGLAASGIASAWLVSASPQRALLVLVRARGALLPRAAGLARQIAQEVEIEPVAPLEDLGTLARRGMQLAEMLQRRGGQPWWRDGQQVFYRGQINGRAFARIVTTRPRTDGGYDGNVRLIVRSEDYGPLYVEEINWRVDSRARAYEVSRAKQYTRLDDGRSISLRDRRAAGSPTVERIGAASHDDLDAGQRIPVGGSFVCPPLEDPAESWVAERSGGAWLIEVSADVSAGTCSRLLVSLPPDDAGHRRMWSAVDYLPTGRLVVFDRDGLARRIEHGDYFEQRVSAGELETLDAAATDWIGPTSG